MKRNLIIVIFGITVLILLISNFTNTNKFSPTDIETLIDDDQINGNLEAQLTIVEFSDYECPVCQRFYATTYQELKKEYIDTGKVNIVYRDFPLTFHKNAQEAAEAAECAGEQGKYYEMHDQLLGFGVSGGTTTYKNYAENLGLDIEQFNECLDSREMKDEVRKDLKDGQKIGISGTPSFIINGELIVGAQPFSVFQEKIEATLK
jgi:protein-disulfide isomerase